MGRTHLNERIITYALLEDVRRYIEAGWRVVVPQEVDLGRVHVSIIVEWPHDREPEVPNADRA